MTPKQDIPIPKTRGEMIYVISMTAMKVGGSALLVALIAYMLYGVYLVNDKQTANSAKMIEANVMAKENEAKFAANQAVMAENQKMLANTLSIVAANQELLVTAVRQKNESIEHGNQVLQQNHEMLLASQRRDEVLAQSIGETGMVTREMLTLMANLDKLMTKADVVMGPVPEMRKAQLQELKDQSATLSKILVAVTRSQQP